MSGLAPELDEYDLPTVEFAAGDQTAPGGICEAGFHAIECRGGFEEFVCRFEAGDLAVVMAESGFLLEHHLSEGGNPVGVVGDAGDIAGC